MIPKKAFYFIRHGETEWNKLGIYMGSQNIPLNATGVKQAKEAALLLKQEPIDNIVSSSLIRALQTAEIISETINKPITIIDNFKERYLGVKEGKRVNESIPIEELVINTYDDEEKADLFQNRVISSMNDVLNNSSGNLLIVSHGGVYAAMCSAMKWPVIDIENCASIYHIPPGENRDLWLIHPLKNQPYDY